MWEEYAKDPANALEWQQTYMNFMFDLEDSSGESIRELALRDGPTWRVAELPQTFTQM